MVYRIYALKNLGNIKKSDFGYFIEQESNLSPKGGCVGGGVHLINALTGMNVFL